MKIKCLFILLLNISLAYGQDMNLRGYIVDAQSGAPIPSANLSIPAKNLFYPTDSDGEFTIVDNKIAKADSLSISFIGYKTLTIKVGDIKPGDKIKLTIMVKVLPEVKIGLFQFGSKAKSEELWAAYGPRNEHIMFMNGSKNVKGTIQSVGFYLGDAEGGDAIAPFRVKIYEAVADSIPGTELTKDILIISAKKNNAWFDVDLSAYNLQNPVNGFFVAFCLIDARHYKASNGTQLLTPRLGMTENELKTSQSFRGEYKHQELEWYKEPFTYNYMIRASVVPE